MILCWKYVHTRCIKCLICVQNAMLLKCVHIMCNNKFLCVYMMQENIFVCLHDKVDFFICVCILQIRICAIKHCDVEIGGNQNTHRKSLSDMSQLPSHEITSSAIKKGPKCPYKMGGLSWRGQLTSILPSQSIWIPSWGGRVRGYGVLATLSTIFQLYRGRFLSWWDM